MSSFKLYLYYLFVHLLPETRLFGLKSCLLRWCGARVGYNVRVSSSAKFVGTGRLIVGNDVWIGSGVRIATQGDAAIKIGDCVDIAPEVYIGTGTHMIDAEGKHSAGTGLNRDVIIGDGVWLCARSVILPGVVVGEKSIVAAGAVVSGNVAERVLVGGVPARRIKDI